MRTHGTLIKWNEARGFGFIGQDSGEIFVHILAFPRDGRRPQLHELVSFETELGPNGKMHAVRVTRASDVQSMHRKKSPVRAGSNRFSAAILMALVLGLGVFVYAKFFNRTLVTTQQTTVRPRAQPVAAPRAAFSCDHRKHCSQMTSCEEAHYFLANCPNTQMDGDGDRVPCEQQWCG